MAARIKTRSREFPSPPAGPAPIRVLTSERILEIHEAVSAFLAEADPMRVALGVRDPSLLESAVSRQFMGSVGEISSADPREKTAMLVTGLLEERPFHDACAATAFLAGLVHLDDNGFVPNKVSFDEHHRVFAALWEGRPEDLGSRKGQADDSSALRLYRWLLENTRRGEAGALPLAVSHLQRRLEALGFALEQAEEGASRLLSVGRLGEEREKRLFGLGGSRTVAKVTPVHGFSLPEDAALVPARTVRDLARACGLEEADLLDAQARLDSLLRQHATLVQRLARL